MWQMHLPDSYYTLEVHPGGSQHQGQLLPSRSYVRVEVRTQNTLSARARGQVVKVSLSLGEL
jgi:hypothetical protein